MSRGLLTWNHEGKGFRTSCLKRGVELVQGLTYMEARRGRFSEVKRGVKLGQGFTDMEARSERFQKKQSGLKREVFLIR